MILHNYYRINHILVEITVTFLKVILQIYNNLFIYHQILDEFKPDFPFQIQIWIIKK